MSNKIFFNFNRKETASYEEIKKGLAYGYKPVPPRDRLWEARLILQEHNFDMTVTSNYAYDLKQGNLPPLSFCIIPNCNSEGIPTGQWELQFVRDMHDNPSEGKTLYIGEYSGCLNSSVTHLRAINDIRRVVL